MGELIIRNKDNYQDGAMSYWISPGTRTSGIKIPKEIISVKEIECTGYISYRKERYREHPLELSRVFPLRRKPKLMGTGLGSFILSHTFLKLYKDSSNDETISPDTNIFVNTSEEELVSILENRGFIKGIPGYETTIQEAAQESERILRDRNWL